VKQLVRGPDPRNLAGLGLFRAFFEMTEEDRDDQEYPFGEARGWHEHTSLMEARESGNRNIGLASG
jgi:hypothetical protein